MLGLRNTVRFDLQSKLSSELRKLDSLDQCPSSNPVVLAANTWQFVAKHLETIIGPNIYRQWFQSICPIVLSNQVLILKSPFEFNVHWINHNYQNLIDALLQIKCKDYRSFFVSQSDFHYDFGECEDLFFNPKSLNFYGNQI